jgi:hypothetical protein
LFLHEELGEGRQGHGEIHDRAMLAHISRNDGYTFSEISSDGVGMGIFIT